MCHSNNLELFLASVDSSLLYPDLSSVNNLKQNGKQHLFRAENISMPSDNSIINNRIPSSLKILNEQKHKRRRRRKKNRRKRRRRNPQATHTPTKIVSFPASHWHWQNLRQNSRVTKGRRVWGWSRELGAKDKAILSLTTTLAVVKRGQNSTCFWQGIYPSFLSLGTASLLLFVSFHLIPQKSVTAVSSIPHFPNAIHMQFYTFPILIHFLSPPQLLKTSLYHWNA